MELLVVIYIVCATILTIYGINCHVMTHLFQRRVAESRKRDAADLEAFYGSQGLTVANSACARLPRVTTQIPIYNEANVIARCIDACAAMEYPAGMHEIQVLDDSTDETRDIVAAKVAEWRAKGVDIVQVHRPDRKGFKAGALRYAQEFCKGDYIAIFDADFVPPKDFLLRSIPYFVDHPEIGFVQGRWDHLNRDESLITQLQAVGIDGHFMIEQSARNYNGLYLNFNGTAGVFSKKAIYDAGNWQDDTLTEDMDLSYRIQLVGYDCRFLIDLAVPAEIPADMAAFKAQQFRWAKGSIQTAIKLMPQVMMHKGSFFKKFQAFMHMSHYGVHPIMLFLAILAMPVMAIGNIGFEGMPFLVFITLLLLSCSGPNRLYMTAQRALGHSFWKTLALIPAMVLFGCGLAVNNTKAVIEAVMGKQSAFVRTPKAGVNGGVKQYKASRSKQHMWELLAGSWCMIGVVCYFADGHYAVGPFLLIYALGFLGVGAMTVGNAFKWLRNK
ncbi:glycosyltransferase [Megalodesulfovibrio gigas]|uniref:Putative glycosyltransferase, group 2 family protein n=1 Tax=Megalodesulfovibrio gigas (strain ATCC 19364 / DSM 1382 / NCIMB 9332 / VKM B-1759) TaxID=1121448 RepID=T2G7N2_MEGG1|nr:glycosyltransferase [Megalodesulfovibrio gigas]AGW12303.1 putative glycosyltransferase, group 2 family protein [Megalodesulfovibrio gigas DSM 1382 = ATCC 19364]